MVCEAAKTSHTQDGETMNEPQWCDVKQAFCYCQERCIEEDDDYGPEEDTGEDTNVEDWSSLPAAQNEVPEDR